VPDSENPYLYDASGPKKRIDLGRDYDAQDNLDSYDHDTAI